MDFFENDQLLRLDAVCHRGNRVMLPVSQMLEDSSSLCELMLWSFGALAASQESEKARERDDVEDHEGFRDCETHAPFWRGVFDQVGYLTMFVTRGHRSGSVISEDDKSYTYPKVEMKCTLQLMFRFYDFAYYSEYPSIAAAMKPQIDRAAKAEPHERPKIVWTGEAAWKLVKLVYDGYITQKRAAADKILAWRPRTLTPEKINKRDLRPLPKEEQHV